MEKSQDTPKVVNVSVYLSISGNVSGPYDLRQLADMYSNDELLPDTLCCFGSGDWKRIYDLPLINIIREASTAHSSPMSQASAYSDEELPPDDFLLPQSNEVDDDSPIITCPHCWYEFHLSTVNYISTHPSLIGDSVLGETAQTRFLPSRFNTQGYALDARGMVCRDMACPRCHLKIPEIALDEKPDVISIVGAPASGKSYYITALANSLRRNLPSFFDYSFTDADVSMNYTLTNYEDTLFHNSADTLVSLPKTELEGVNFSSQVTLQGITVNLPLPFIFTMRKIHDNAGAEGGVNMHNVVMYDNAGEHFEAGRDSIVNQATMHLSNSRLIMFLFDPFKDSRALKDCDPEDPEANVALRSINQGQFLREMINRIRKIRGMSSVEKSDKILTVLVPKFDSWINSFPFDLKALPYTTINKATYEYSLNLTIVKIISYCTRQWLLERAPDIVTDSEVFFNEVYFLPVSALGARPIYDAERNMIGIKPNEIEPVWVDVPFYLYLWRYGFIPAVKCKIDEECIPIEGTFKNDNFVFMDSHTKRPQTVPSLYWGECVYDMNLGKYIRFPEKPVETEEDKENPSSSEDSFWNS